MQFTRRTFGKSAIALAAAPWGALAITGCTPSQIENELNTVLQEAVNLIAVVEPTAFYLADLKSAVAALKQAEAAWQGGSPVQVLVSVLNTLLDVMAVIPEAAPYIQLAQILVAGIVALLGLIPAPLPSIKGKVPNMTVAVLKSNPLIGKKTVKSVADSKAQWHAAVLANPALAVADLK
jgi:hypothetical protein